MLRVIVADLRPLVRTGLHTVLSATAEVEILHEECTLSTLLRCCDQRIPDILILSVHFAGVELDHLLLTLHQRYPCLPVLLVSEYGESWVGDQKLLLTWSNVKGVISLHEPVAAWVSALRTIARGAIWLNQAGMNHWLGQSRQPTPSAPKLSPREGKVLQLVAAGCTNKEIARQLNIVERTVEFHINNILHKLQVASRVEAALWFQAQQAR